MPRPAMSILIGSVDPRETADLARQYEQDGWDGIYCVDRECIGADVYAQLTLVAAATERVELGTWVTNPATRHPAVTAGAITTVDVLSGGRGSARPRPR
jgi:5,10-methylenetetrahydromethanopterin reductase